MSNANKYYAFWISFFLLGHLIILITFIPFNSGAESLHSFCLIKSSLGYPCPMCGSTRAAVLLYEGQLLSSLAMNPLGVIILITGWIGFLWTLKDLWEKEISFWNFYKKVGQQLKSKKIITVIITLILLNWGWMIMSQV